MTKADVQESRAGVPMDDRIERAVYGNGVFPITPAAYTATFGGGGEMSDYAGWSRKDLEKEISAFAACRDACLRGDWGADRRYLAEGYALRVDGLVAALTRLRFPPKDGASPETPKVRTPK